jgi:nucleoside-diphosphate-sugar epimerase
MSERGSGTVLVLGATGQVGVCILKRLAAVGRPAIALCRHPPASTLPGIEWLPHDLRQPLDLGAAKAETAIHATGAWHLQPHLTALGAAGVRRLVCFSSTSKMTKADSSSAGERNIAGRLDAAERAVAESGMAWTVLRPTLIYGLGLDQNVSAAARFIRRWHFFPLAGPGRGLRQPVHADDLAAAALSLIDDEAHAGRAFDVAGGETMTYRAMIERIFRALGLRPLFLRLPGLGAMPGRIGAVAQRMERNLTVDNNEVWQKLGLAPRAFLAGGRADLGSAAS